MPRVYFKGAWAALVVFDRSQGETLEAARLWKRDLEAKVTEPHVATQAPGRIPRRSIDLAIPPRTT
jgi:hypothetical protein